MKELNLSPKEVHRFGFKTYSCHREAPGKTPSDAYANLVFQGTHSGHAEPGYLASNDECFDLGLEQIARIINTPPPWTAAPTLWPRLRKDARIRKLAGTPPRHDPLRPLWKEKDFDTWDSLIATSLTLLDTIPFTKAKTQSFMLKERRYWGVGGNRVVWHISDPASDHYPT